MCNILRIVCFLAFAVGTLDSNAVSDRCPKYWSYHEHTATCIRKFSTERNFGDAKRLCERYKGGPSGDQPGWMVSIHDTETDNFVKNLLSDGQRAYIGLVKNGDSYDWLDKTTMTTKYYGWKNDFPTNGWSTYKYVIITRDGWEDRYYSSRKYPYVCQQYPSFSSPNLSCVSAEEGSIFPRLYCSYPVDATLGDFVTSVVKNSRDNLTVECDSNLLCHNSASYTGQIYEEKTSATFTTEIIVNKHVTRKDDGIKWSCWYKFDKTPDNLLEIQCNMQTYKQPHKFNCSYTFPSNGGILVACETFGGYPKFSSDWREEGKWLGKRDGTHVEVKHGETLSYNSRFQMRFNDVGQGKQNVTCLIYPRVRFQDDEAKSKATRTETVEFTISVPEEPPVFSTTNGSEIIMGNLTAADGQTVILVCDVNGGRPHVSRTYIQCDGKYVRDTTGQMSWASSSKKVNAELRITKAMDQKVCTCKAQHVSKQYKKTASVTLNVPHVAEIASFTVNNRPDENEVTEGRAINLRCDAHGNPMPHLHLYKLDNEGKIQTTIEERLSKKITFQVTKSSCNMSGTYVCTAKNSLSTEISEDRVNLKVKCPPQPCSLRNGDREFSIIPSKAFTFQMCLFAYPQPHSDVRIGPKGESNLNSKDYNAKFIYTNALETEGYIIVNMSASVTKFGDYTIKMHQSDWHYIDFSLVRYQKPSCPKSLDVIQVGNSFAILSWQPAFDRGILQIFSISTIHFKGEMVDRRDVEDNGKATMIYKITDLDGGSSYKFRLSVKNIQGLTECRHLEVNITTQDNPISATKAEEKTNGMVIGVVLAVLVIFASIIILIAVFLRRRKENKQPKMPIWLRRGKKEPKRFNEVTELKTASVRTQPGPTEIIYSKVNKPRKKYVEEEESVYTNKAAIEFYNRNTHLGSQGHPTVAYHTQHPDDHRDRSSSYFEWSDADDSADDEMDEAGASYREVFHETCDIAYVNTVSLTGGKERQREKRHTSHNSSFANRNLENEDISETGERNRASGGITLVYTDVEFCSSEQGGSSPHPTAQSDVRSDEKPVDYASLNYDATLGL